MNYYLLVIIGLSIMLVGQVILGHAKDRRIAALEELVQALRDQTALASKTVLEARRTVREARSALHDVQERDRS